MLLLLVQRAAAAYAASLHRVVTRLNDSPPHTLTPADQVTIVVAPMIALQDVVPPTPQRPVPLPITAWAMDRGAATPLAALAKQLANAITSLTYFEETFNVSFPLPKEDFAYIPGYPGASESGEGQ